MGEFSRFKGELGESIAGSFLGDIGWQYISNIEFDCAKRKKHNKSKHGIDFFAAYISPLEADVLDTVTVSVKYATTKNSKEDFKKYLTDLSSSSDCFLLSRVYNDAINGFKYSRIRHSLVVFWIDNTKEINYNLTKTLKGVSDDINTEFDQTYVVDNYRVNFIFNSLKFINRLYEKENVDFCYHNTGINEKIVGGRQLSGKLLPIDYISSDILLFKIVEKKVLIICVNEKFEKETFKRVVGLSQNLTSGWCQNIIIAFPDYQLLLHKDVKQLVLMSFSDINFVSMIEVRNFNDNFYSLESKELIKEIGSPTHAPNFDIETMLPFGDQIRQLLNHSYINKNDLIILLQSRGVFVRKSMTKEDITPYFAKTLLSPTEFEYLRRKQAAKEDTEKYATTYLKTDVVEEVNVALNVALPHIRQEILKKFPNCQLINDLKVERSGNGEIKISLEANQYNLNKDWTNISSKQKAEVTFSSRESKENNGTEIISAYSSHETKQMAAIVIREVVNNLKKMNLVPKEEKPVKLLSADFSRVQRNNFLIKFLDSVPKGVNLHFRQLTSVDFTLDDDAEGLPEEFLSMRNRVDESVFTGRNLEEIKYLSDASYRHSLIFYSFIAEYFFEYKILETEGVKGKTEIQFGFLSTKNQERVLYEKIEFEYRIKDITPFLEENVSQRERHLISIQIQADFEKMKLVNAEEFIEKYSQLELFETVDPRKMTSEL